MALCLKADSKCLNPTAFTPIPHAKNGPGSRYLRAKLALLPNSSSCLSNEFPQSVKSVFIPGKGFAVGVSFQISNFGNSGDFGNLLNLLSSYYLRFPLPPPVSSQSSQIGVGLTQALGWMYPGSLAYLFQSYYYYLRRLYT
jgi:hypothetical protein